MTRTFRLTNEPGGLGLSFTDVGVSLAGVPLLHRTRAGLRSRSEAEIAALMKAAYGADPTRLQSSLGAIARALDEGDFARAAIAAVQARTPELSQEAAARLADAAEELAKYDPGEPRDWHGRWTRDGAAAQGNPKVPKEDVPKQSPADRSVSVTPVAIASSDEEDESEEDESQVSTSLEQTFEKEYDDLGPVEFAKQVIQFGDRLGREGKNFSPTESEHALAEYSFLQDRLSFWLAYDYKPPTAQANLHSAALTLYQGAINGGIVQVDHLPRSMLDVAGAAWAFDNVPPRFNPEAKPFSEAVPPPPPNVPKEIDGMGVAVDNSEVGIQWKGREHQGKDWEAYNHKVDPNLQRLHTHSKAFDQFNPITSEAISNKTMNTLCVTYIRYPRKIYRTMEGYIDEAADYVKRKNF